jgi:peptidoglycan/LPS O-acetylase OafA/YrhL
VFHSRDNPTMIGGIASRLIGDYFPSPTLATQKFAAVYRPDVDGLRALAVFAVVLFHYFGTCVPSGHLGVDVFFVISGYVITSYLLSREVKPTTTFLLTFYARRIKRLMPALAVCVVITALLFVLLTARPPSEAFGTGAFALLGLSNIQLFQSSQEYSSLDALLNPFTQTWSLGVEEQFYFLYPALIVGTKLLSDTEWQAHIRLCVVLFLLSAASFFLWVILQRVQPDAAFYLMPPRFWELGVGGLTFLVTSFRSNTNHPWIANLGGLAIVVCFFSSADWSTAMCPFVVAATAFLIFAGKVGTSWAYRILAAPAVVYIGRRSYSVYLWHWSVLVLGKWTFGDSPFVLLILLTVALLCAVVSFSQIEEPLRRVAWARSSFRTVIIGLSIILPLFIGVRFFVHLFAQRNIDNLPQLLGVDPPPAESPDPCDGREALSKLADPIQSCLAAERKEEKPHVLYLLGDSHAAQFLPTVRAFAEGSEYLTRFINLEDAHDFVLSFTTPARESRLLDFVVSHSHPGDIVVITFHRGRLNSNRDRHISLGTVATINDKTNNFISAMSPYITKFSQARTRIVFIADTPLMGAVASGSACALQMHLFGSSICRVSKEQDLHTRRRQDFAFRTLMEEHPGDVLVWDPIDEIYSGSTSFDVMDTAGSYIMRDWNHITKREAELLAPSLRNFLKRNGL